MHYEKKLDVSKMEVHSIALVQSMYWKNQIDQVCSKISSKIYLLSKIKKYLNLESRQLFYSGYILPLIDYCCVVWGNCYVKVFLKSSAFAFGICNFSLTTFRREYRFLSDK
jgi:hypothetical protein